MTDSESQPNACRAHSLFASIAPFLASIEALPDAPEHISRDALSCISDDQAQLLALDICAQHNHATCSGIMERICYKIHQNLFQPQAIGFNRRKARSEFQL